MGAGRILGRRVTLLIGKALFIYWPHSWNKIPYVNVPFPFFPNFCTMGLCAVRTLEGNCTQP